MERLRSYNVMIPSSTATILRHVISEEIESYRAKLSKSDRTIAELYQKLIDLED